MSGSPSQPGIPPGLSQAMAQRFLGAASTPEVFANQVRMAISVTDFTLVFGTSLTDGGRGIGSVGMGVAASLDKVILHVAPGMLKQLLLQIEMAIGAYESVMGDIKVPNSLPTHLATHKIMMANMLRQMMEGDVPSEEDIDQP